MFVEADGKWVHLQQTRGQRDLELYLGLAHEGWEREGPDRWRLQEKQVHLDVGGKLRFWEGFSARLAERYDLRDTRVVLNGDGADWVREGPKYFHRAYGQLDRFHLGQALRQVLDGPEWRSAYRAACRGELLPAVRAILRRGHPDGPAVIQYLQNNRSGLADYRLQDGFRDAGLRGLGACEANIDKVIANRMSKRGMAWTIAWPRCSRPPTTRSSPSTWRVRADAHRFVAPSADSCAPRRTRPSRAWVGRKPSAIPGPTAPPNAAGARSCVGSADPLRSGSKTNGRDRTGGLLLRNRVP